MNAQAAELVLQVRQSPEGESADGATPSARFDQRGGAVGRSSRCDLVLPDPTNSVSRQHFQIVYEAGRFLAVDTSANGLFINGRTEAVGHGNRAAIQEGDHLALGDYVLLVAGVRTPVESAARAGGEAADPRAMREATLSGNPFAQPDARAAGGGDAQPNRADDQVAAGARMEVSHEDLDPFGLPEGLARDPFADAETDDFRDWRHQSDAPAAPSIGDGPHETDPIIPEDYDPLADIAGADGPCAASEPVPPQPDHVAGWRSPLSDVMGAVQTPGETAEPAIEQASGPTGPSAPADPHAEADAGLAAFCRGAGLDAETLAGEDATAVLERAGALFAAMGQGTAGLLRARGAFKQEFRVQRTTLGAADNNPLKFTPDAETAMTQLLRPSVRGYMTGPRAVEEAFSDINDHEVALVAAMHRALEHVLAEFEPASLENRLEGLSLRDVLPGGRSARTWELYQEHYARIAERAEDIFDGALGREFVKAYEDATRNS